MKYIVNGARILRPSEMGLVFVLTLGTVLGPAILINLLAMFEGGKF